MLTVLNSNVFGLQSLDAPISTNAWRLINLYSIFGLFFENIPQLCVQIDIAFKIESNDLISVLSVMVSGFDILNIMINAIMHCVFHSQRKEIEKLNKKNSNNNNNNDTILLQDYEFDKFNDHNLNNEEISAFDHSIKD